MKLSATAFAYAFFLGQASASSSKSMKSGKRGPAPLKRCVFANPSLFLESLSDGTYVNLDLDEISYINDEFSNAVESWIEDKASPKDIFEMGKKTAIAANPFEVCVLARGLIAQMEDTCMYQKYETAYVNTAANFMHGVSFTFGNTAYNLLNCPYPDGVTFGELYSEMLTQETHDSLVMTDKCYYGLAGLEFNLRDFGKFPIYFRDDSYFILSEAGRFEGADAIEEYVRFAADTPFSSSYYIGLDIGLKDVVGSDCYFWYSAMNRGSGDLDYNPIELVVDFGTTSTVTYSVESNYVKGVEVYYPKSFIEFYFNHLDTPQVRNFTCDVMNSCGADIETQTCVDMMDDLPILTGDAYFDGNSQGCRNLHGIMASDNPHHCPHIMFDPTPDDEGKIKCQTSAGYDPMDFFNDEDLERYYLFLDEFDVDRELGYKVLVYEEP